jgi:tetratricopeptide (TPR) repeat protein
LKEEASDFYKQKKFKEAIVVYEKCLKLDSFNEKYNSTLYFNISMCHSELKDYESCISALDKCLKLNDIYAKAYMKRGETNMLLEDYEEAIKDFN